MSPQNTHRAPKPHGDDSHRSLPSVTPVGQSSGSPTCRGVTPVTPHVQQGGSQRHPFRGVPALHGLGCPWDGV